ncbi:MAG: hypothetical protein HY747_09890 [Elusimicrobia bacterium]|nr:hypothetical protein [Elusimicrobiota bacterium]
MPELECHPERSEGFRAGIACSYWLDTPTGATIIGVFGAALVLMVIAKRLLPGQVSW